MKTRIRISLCLALALASAVAASPAQALVSPKKAIWGPVTRGGVSQFPIYRDLKVGIYLAPLKWHEISTRRPLDPTNPADPAYAWPADLDQAAREVTASNMRMGLMIYGTPSWANGGRARNWVPKDPADLANFATAAARRYPTVNIWMIWGEPTRQENFMPLARERRGRPLNARQRRAPQYYARMLDASYAALHAVRARNIVVGGNSFTTGDISPRNWIRNLRLPSGRAPRMDMYGHNPFTGRKPSLRKPPLRYGLADFSDLDTLAGWLDRYLRPRLPSRKRLKVFIAEWLLPTDHPNHEFNFWVSRRTQASWLKAALRITRRWSRIYTLAWFSLYDDPPNRRGDHVNRGLLDHRGNKKPAYFSYRRG